MFKVIESPTKCEIRSVIRFLTVRNMSAADIHHQKTETYGSEAMNYSKVRKWVRKFKDGNCVLGGIPRLLTVEHKEKRFVILLGFLIRYEEEGDDMLSRIVTGHGTWVSHITPESKQQ
ncbi:mariner Mos1 transposase [Trichonephila clavipes]|nr:mariner Mos1 transposase [Trichonephila clavipes]